MSSVAPLATAPHQSCLLHTQVLANFIYTCCRLHPKKRNTTSLFRNLETSTFVSHNRVTGSLLPAPAVCLWMSSWRAFILPYGQTPPAPARHHTRSARTCSARTRLARTSSAPSARPALTRHAPVRAAHVARGKIQKRQWLSDLQSSISPAVPLPLRGGMGGSVMLVVILAHSAPRSPASSVCRQVGRASLASEGSQARCSEGSFRCPEGAHRGRAASSDLE
jgi:hypothetical protein